MQVSVNELYETGVKYRPADRSVVQNNRTTGTTCQLDTRSACHSHLDNS